MALRYAALTGFGPHQARPQQAPFVGAALEHQVTRCWVPLVALRYAALAGFGLYQAGPQQTPLVGAALVALARDGHQQALCGAALVVTMTSVAAWAALDPQLTPDGAALVALVGGSHRQALCWAALVSLVDLVAARLQGRATRAAGH